MTGPRRDGDEAGAELRARLHAAAGTHRPDRARMLARVERGMTAGEGGPARPSPPGWVRVAGATAAVAAVLVAGGHTVASVVRDDAPVPRPATGAHHAPAPGRLWSSGAVDPHSNDFWAQSNVTVRAGTALTALTVELRVAQTGSVTSTGAWRSLPEADFAFTVAERGGFLVYRWTLREGRTVPAGAWVFAGQYNHGRGGRDAGGDRWSVTATAPSGRLSTAGGFTARG
ncbi:hypothetical protein [Streptomyces sp. NPDC048188]|uniref:hypothetical protein n=1 Tax=Streptomyces sp. NPDC048188 TaxID=3155749 RepID=UPI00342312CD